MAEQTLQEPAGSASRPETGQVDGPLRAADGTPLKRKLDQAMRVSRWRAFGLVAPLLAFILAVLIIPIIVFQNQQARQEG